MRSVITRRASFYEGLYDSGARPALVASRVRLLNPALEADDPTSRRFALLEVE
jgi:hypothetical protein